MKWLRLLRLVRIRRTLVSAFGMLRNPRVPLHLKLITLGLALLILSPLNILGDIPLFGLVDDVALMSILASWFIGAALRSEQARASAATDLILVAR